MRLMSLHCTQQSPRTLFKKRLQKKSFSRRIAGGLERVRLNLPASEVLRGCFEIPSLFRLDHKGDMANDFYGALAPKFLSTAVHKEAILHLSDLNSDPFQ